MKKITFKSGITRVCLMSFILFISVFANQNVFSGIHWNKDLTKIQFDQQTGIVNLDFIFYDNTTLHLSDGFLERCIFEYSVDRENWTALMRVRTDSQKNNQELNLTMFGKKRGAKIRLLNCVKPQSGTFWPDVLDKVEVEASVQVIARHTKMMVEWELPTDIRQSLYIRVRGNWKILGVKNPDNVNHVYPVFVMKSKPKKINTTKISTTPTELNSEISNNVKVIGEIDAIIVSGVESGENIKVCNNEGKEVKSVVATDNVVNIKLQKSQKYIVKIGEASYKVAL